MLNRDTQADIISDTPDGVDPDDFVVVSNPPILKEIIIELVTNAITAMSERGGTVLVGLRIVDGAVNVTVSDTGCGIPADKLDRIMTPGYTTKEGGSGRGLSCIQSYVEQDLGGTFTVSSTEGVGSEMDLRLPLGK